MSNRLSKSGAVVAVAGLGFLAAGGVACTKVQDGYGSLQASSETQNIELSYNEDRQLIDRGSVEEAEEIMQLLTEDAGASSPTPCPSRS